MLRFDYLAIFIEPTMLLNESYELLQVMFESDSDIISCVIVVKKKTYADLANNMYKDRYYFKNQGCYCGLWEGLDSVNRLNHTSWMTVGTPLDRPESVRNRCVKGLSQISSFFSSSLPSCIKSYQAVLENDSTI